jgi:hypothetical protein
MRASTEPALTVLGSPTVCASLGIAVMGFFIGSVGWGEFIGFALSGIATFTEGYRSPSKTTPTPSLMVRELAHQSLSHVLPI